MLTHRILLIDDHAMFRSGLNMVLSTAISDVQIFEAGSLNEAIANTPDNMDIILLDIQLNGLNGLEGLPLIKRKWPQVPILMLSSHDEAETITQALARGASGFVSKSETAEKIIEAINQLLLGQLPAPPVSLIAQRSLTPRQFEVLELLHQGLSNKLIARKLGLSNNTVRRHVQDILEFFGVANRTEAVFTALSQGLIR